MPDFTSVALLRQRFLPSPQVPRSIQSEWEGKCWPLQRCVREFQAVANADSAIASNDNIKTEVKMLADAEFFRTP